MIGDPSDRSADVVAARMILEVLSPIQVMQLAGLICEVIEQHHGEVRLRISGDRLFLIKSESYDGGILPSIGKGK